MWDAIVGVIYNNAGSWFKGHLWVVWGIVAAIVFINIAIAIWGVAKGNEVSLLFGLWKITPNKTIQQLQKEFEQLNEDSKQKTQIVKVLDAIVKECSKAGVEVMNNLEFDKYKNAVYDFALPGILSVMTKSKHNVHRLAIFVPDGSNELKIHEGVGYSPEGKTNLRLSMDSIAGKVFTTGKFTMSNDLRSFGSDFKPHPMAKREINSLLCVPIMCGKIIVGVLNLDGEEKNSFTSDDRDFLVYFANAIAIFLQIDLTRTSSTIS